MGAGGTNARKGRARGTGEGPHLASFAAMSLRFMLVPLSFERD